MKIGILLPRSTVHPTIGHDFLDGCKSSLQNRALEYAVITENIGFGIDEKEIYSKTESMLLNGNVDVVVLFAGGRYNEMLAPLFTAMGKQLIIVNMGDYFPETLASSSTVIEHGYDTAFNSWLTGKLAAESGKSSAVVATSFYDGGYLNVFSMVTSYQRGGGSIAYNFVSHFKKDQFSTATLEDYLGQHPEQDQVLCIYSGDVSHLIYRTLEKIQQQRKISAFVSPMMLDEGLKQLLGTDTKLKNIWGYTSWLSSFDNEENKIYKSMFSGSTGRVPNLFGLLGWETGTILQQMSVFLKEGLKGIELTGKLIASPFISPRGWLRIDSLTQRSYSPSFLVSVSDGFDITIESVKEDESEERALFRNARPEGSVSGWRNTYLCS